MTSSREHRLKKLLGKEVGGQWGGKRPCQRRQWQQVVIPEIAENMIPWEQREEEW